MSSRSHKVNGCTFEPRPPRWVDPPTGLNLAHIRTIMLAVLAATRRPILRHTDALHLRPVVVLNLEAATGLQHATRALKALAFL